MTVFPQYAKTDHADVVAAIEKIDSLYRDFIDRCRDLSQEMVGEPDAAHIYGWKLEWFNITGLNASAVRKAGIGEGWTKPTSQGYTRPKKSDPDYSRFKFGYEAPQIPGRSHGNTNIIHGDGYMGVGACFIHEGTVYSSFGFRPTDDIKDVEQYGWTEITASRFQLAVDAFQETKADTTEAHHA